MKHTEKALKSVIMLGLIFILLLGFALYYFISLKKIDVASVMGVGDATNSMQAAVVESSSSTSVGDVTEDGQKIYNIITSPKAGDTVPGGNSLNIVWDASQFNVFTILLMPQDSDSATGIEIYKHNDTNDQVSKSGKFTYSVPKDSSVPSGEYRIKLVDEEGHDGVFSDPFAITQ